MLLAYFAFVVIACCASAAPGRSRNFDDFWFGFPYGYASPFGAYASVGGFPFLNPFTPWSYFPRPDYRMFMPWYKGPNVCETKKVIDEPDQIKEWFSEGFSDSDYKMESESQSCKGDNTVYVCMNRQQTNEGSKLELTKYKCCMGFVRSTDGSPGCVESGEADPSVATPVSSSSVRTNDRFSYSYVKGNRGGKSGVENVPIQ